MSTILQTAFPRSLRALVLTIAAVGLPAAPVAGFDDCTTPLPIFALPYSSSQSSEVANDDYQLPGAPAGGLDTVYSLTVAGGTREFHFEVAAAWDALAYLVTDCNDVAGTLVASSSRMGPLTTSYVEHFDAVLTDGVTYYLIVDGAGASQKGTYWLSVDDAPYEGCLAAGQQHVIPTLVPAFLNGGSTAGLSNDHDIAFPCLLPMSADGPDVAYRFVPAQSGAYRLSLSNDQQPVYLFVSPDGGTSCVSDAAWSVNSTNAPGSEWTSPAFNLAAGTTYCVIVDTGAANPSVNYGLRLAFANPAASGWNCFNPSDVTGSTNPVTILWDTSAGVLMNSMQATACTFTVPTTAPGKNSVLRVDPPTSRARFRAVSAHDAVLYASATCPTGGSTSEVASCIGTANAVVGGGEEVLTLSGLVPGTQYFVFVDGAGAADNGDVAISYEKLPDNDDCATAKIVPPAQPAYVDASGFTTFAADDYDATCSSAFVSGTPGPDVVYEITPNAPSSPRPFRIRVAPAGGSQYDPAVYVATGCGPSFGTCVGSANAQFSGGAEDFTVDLENGQTYRIYVDSTEASPPGATGEFSFSIDSWITGDVCDRAIEVTFPPQSGSFSTASMWNDYSSIGANPLSGRDAVLRFQLSSGSTYVLILDPSYDVALLQGDQAVTGCPATWSTAALIDDTTGCGERERHVFTPTDFTPVQFLVDGASGGSGSVNWRIGQPPGNDTSVGAPSLFLGADPVEPTIFSGDVTYAGNDSGSPTIACPTGSFGFPGPDVFWSFQPFQPGFARYRFDVIPAGFDVALSIFDSGTGACLGAVDSAGLNGAESLQVQLQNGTIYHFAVDSSDCAAVGTFTGSLDLVPANDSCVFAEVISIDVSNPVFERVGRIDPANDDFSGTTADCPSAGDDNIAAPGRDVVFRWVVAPGLIGKTFYASLASEFDGILYAASVCPAGTPPAAPVTGCIDAANTGAGRAELLEITPSAGGTIFFFVDSAASSTGLYVFRLEPAYEPGDNCGVAVPVVTAPLAIPYESPADIDTSLYWNEFTTFEGCETWQPAVGEGPDVVHRLVVTRSGRFRIRALPQAPFDPILYVFPDSANVCSQSTIVNPAVCSSFADDGGSGDPEELVLDLVAGTSYDVVVDGRQGADVGLFRLSIVLAGEIEVSASGTDTGDPGDPNVSVVHPGTITGLNLGLTNRDLAASRTVAEVRVVSLTEGVSMVDDTVDLSGSPLVLGVGAAGAPDPQSPDYPYNVPTGELLFLVSQAAGCGTRADFRVEITCADPADSSVDFVSVPLGVIAASSFVRSPAVIDPSLGLGAFGVEWSEDGNVLTTWTDSAGIRAYLTDPFGNKLIAAPVTLNPGGSRALSVRSRGGYFQTEYGIASAGSAALNEYVSFGRLGNPGFFSSFSAFGTSRIAINPFGMENAAWRTVDLAFGQRIVFGNPQGTVLVAWAGEYEPIGEAGWPLEVAYCPDTSCSSPQYREIAKSDLAITNVAVDWDGVGWVLAWDEARPGPGYDTIHRYVTFLDPTGLELAGARVLLSSDGPAVSGVDPRQRTSMIWDGTTYALAWSYESQVIFSRLHSSGTFGIEPGIAPTVVANLPGGAKPRFVDLAWVPSRGHYRITWTDAAAFGKVQTIAVRPDGTVDPGEVVTDVSATEFGHRTLRPLVHGNRELIAWNGGSTGYDQRAKMSLVDPFTAHSLVNAWAGSEKNVTAGFAPSSPMEMDAVRDGERIGLVYSGGDGRLHFWRITSNGMHVDCGGVGSSNAGTMNDSNSLVGPKVAIRPVACGGDLVAVGAGLPDGNGNGHPSSWVWDDAPAIAGTELDAVNRIKGEEVSSISTVSLAHSPTADQFAVAYLWRDLGDASDLHIAVQRVDGGGTAVGGQIVVSTNAHSGEVPSSPSVTYGESASLGYSGRYAVAWVDRRFAAGWQNPSIGFAFVDPASGAVSGEASLFPFTSGTTHPEVEIVWNGTEYGVLYKDSQAVTGGAVHYLRFARVGRDGLAVPGSSVTIDTGSARDISLTWTGAVFAATWVDEGPFHRHVKMAELSRFGELLATPWQIPVGQGQDASPKLLWFGDSYRALYMSNVGYRDVFLTKIEKPATGIVCATVNTRPYPDLKPGGVTGSCNSDSAIAVNLLVPRSGTSVTFDASESTSGSLYLDCGSDDGVHADPGGSILRYEWKLGGASEPSVFDQSSASPTWTVGWNTLTDNGIDLPGTYTVWLRVTDNTEGRPDLSPPGPSSASWQTRSIDLRLVDVTSPTVVLASPNGGDTIVAGSTRTISWSASDDVDVDHYEIYLCSDYGASSCSGSWTLLRTSPAGETAWNWAVPPGQVLSATNRIKVVAYDTAAPACSFPAACDDWGQDESNANFYVVAANPEAVRTLILWNADQFELVHGAPGRAATATKLTELANNARVVGTVFDLGSDPAIAALYSAWNGAGRTDNTAGNALAAGIRSRLYAAGTGLLSSVYTGVRWIVLVGDDRIVPFFRVPDQTGIMYEQKYSQAPLSEIDCTTSEGSAICGNFFLSDAAYADVVADAAGGTTFNLPDYGLGRLVETPAEIATTVNTFIARDGQSPLATALVTGYDFLDDAAISVRNRFQAAGGLTTTALIESVDGNFSAAALQGAFVTTPPKDTFAFLGHANHYTFGVPAGGLSATDMDADPDSLSGTAAFSLGCHSGLNVTTSNASFHPLDLPQEMMRKRAVAYLAPTGFGWGFATGIGLSERLVELYTQQLLAGGTVEVGTAWLEAKRRYFLEQTEVDVFDRKILEEWTIYGLPMFRLAGPAGPEAPEVTPSAGDGVDHVEWNGVTIDKQLSGGGKGVSTASTLPDGLTQLTLSFAFSSSSYSKVTTAGIGDYWRLNGESTAEVGSPLQPKLTYDSRLSGVKLHGTLWLGGVYRPATLLVDDGFESGAIGGGWTNGSPAPFTVSTASPYRGLDSAASGAVAHGASSDLVRNVILTAGGRVTFARRVSSEPGNDFLEFAVDGVTKDAWSGETAWGEVSFPVPSGAHELRWRYVKNGSVSMGSDAAWIDVVRVDDDPDVTPVTGVPQNSSTGVQAQPTPFIRGSVPSVTGTDGNPGSCTVSPTRFDSLTVTTGFLEPVGAGRRQRVFDAYDVASFYSVSCDQTPPAIVGPGPFHTVSGTTASFSVEATDSGSGLFRVVVVYDDTLSVPRAWRPLDLTFNGGTSRWEGSLAFRAATRYVVQAVDSAGNVGVASISQPDLQQGTGESWGTTTTAPLDYPLTFADADADGMADVWEAQYGVGDPDADGDSDGLTNLEEFRAATIPTNPDTDGGGDNDGSEVHHGRGAGNPADDRDVAMVASGSGTITLDWTSSQNAALDGPFWVYRWENTPFYTTGTLLTPSPLPNGTRTFPDTPGPGTFFYLVRNSPFQFPAPTVVAVTPASGPAGTAVTIYGDDFRSGAKVTFGGSLATNVVVVNSSKITCTAPAHAPGLVEVTVVNLDNQGAIRPNAYTYP